MKNKLIYDIKDSPKTLKEWLLYSFQQVLSILTASVLICSICGTDVAAGLVGAGVATLVFLVLTGFKTPLFFSNSGSTCAAVITALAIGHDYTGVVLGGLTICLMNVIAGLITKKIGSGWVDKVLPPIVAGTIVVIIGATLAFFTPTYALVNGAYSTIGVVVALFTMIVTVCTMHYAKGMLSTLPFLVGVGAGYVLAIILTLLGVEQLVDFNALANMSLFIKPDFAFMHIDFKTFDWSTLPTIMLMFAAVNLANLGEHISDVITCSKVTGHDLPKEVGLHKTFIGDGVADLVGCIIAGQPTTTYGESLSTIVVSKVASTKVIACAALMTILLGFFGPLNAVIVSMPNCVFAGVAVVAYGCIAFSGLKVLQHVDLDKTKNMVIFATMLSIGVGGIALTLGSFTFEGIALAMIVGLVLNLLLKEDDAEFNWIFPKKTEHRKQRGRTAPNRKKK